MKIIVFGGGGFIGSTIVDKLLVDGHDLKVFERPRVEPYRQFANHEKIKWLTGDLQSKSDLNNAMFDVDLVVHLVSSTLPKSSNENTIYDVQTNVIGTLQILDIMVEKNIKKIIFISSGGTVYGTPRYLPIDELHPCCPEVSYGITKLTIENYLRLYSKLHGLKTITLRVTNPYGPRQRVETAQGAVGVFMHRANAKLPIEIWGDGSVTRDYVYVDDVAEAFKSAVHYNGDCDVFNISSGLGTSLNELMLVIEDVLNIKINKSYQDARACDVQINVLSHELALQELKWRPKTSLHKGIQLTAAWMIEQAK